MISPLAKKTKPPALGILCFTIFATGLLRAFAADLPPSGTNAINGIVRFTNADAGILARLGPPGNEGMSAFVVVANSEPPDALAAAKQFLPLDPLRQAYDLTVAANDTPLTYSVYAVLTLDGTYEEYYTETHVAAPLTSNSPPATVDLEECVALIELQYKDSLGQPVAALGGRALVKEVATGLWRARYLTQPPGRTGNFLAVPTGVEIELSVEVDTGADLYLDRLTHREMHILTLACDEKPVITLTIPDSGTLGRIVGQANLVGKIELATDGYAELLGRPVIKARGPSGNQRFAAFAADVPGADASRPFTLEGLVPSSVADTWQVQVEMQFGEGHRFEYFITPALGYGSFNPGVEVGAGNDTDLGDTFVMNPAHLVGRLTLAGPAELAGQVSALRGLVRSSDFDDDRDGVPDYVGVAGINGSYAIVTGVDELAPGAALSTAGGQATASFAGAFNPATAAFEGDYEAVVGTLNDEPGVWKYDGLNLVFDHPGTNGGPFVNETLYVFEDEPWQGTLAPGERATNDVYYGFAEVCLRIRSPAPFFYPRIANSYGSWTNYGAIGNVLNSYRVLLGSASAPPYTADASTNEAVVTFYVPQGTYTLQPSISIVDPDGGVSETQLPAIEISVSAGERLCVEGPLRVVLTPPVCTTNFGFMAWADAYSADSTLTNLSLRSSPVEYPDIRLGYSDIRILEPLGIARATLRTGHGLFPEFDGIDRSLYQNILYTAIAKDNQGRVATVQFVAHYDFTAPITHCPGNTNVYADDPSGAVVEFSVSATDERPQPVRGPNCTPPSGSLFPVGVTPVNCIAWDLCRNTNTCSFNVTVGPRPTDCILHVGLTAAASPMLTFTWDCEGTLQCAPEVTGPWSDLPGVTSPHATVAAGSQKFFRIRIP